MKFFLGAEDFFLVFICIYIIKYKSNLNEIFFKCHSDANHS